MRSKLPLLAAIAVFAAVGLYGATQPWVTLSLIEGAAAFASVDVTGHEVNQSLSPILIAALAGALALTIAGRVFRRILGVLVMLLGAGVVTIGVTAMVDPQLAAASKLAEVTGLAGGAEFELVTATTTSPFMVVTLIAGAALVVLGLLVLMLGQKWKQAGRKYEADASRGDVSRASEPDRISDWEAMNEGVDPSDDDARGDSQGMPASR